MVLLGVGALCLVMSGVGIFAHFFGVVRPFFLGVVAAAPYLMMAAPVGLVLLVIGRQWIAVALALALTAVCISSQVRLFTASSLPVGGRDVTVMTANLRLGLADADAVVADVRRHRVDVLMVQELTFDARRRLLAAGLSRELPQSISEPAGGGAGTGLWSRYPLAGAQSLRGFTFKMVRARVELPGQRVAPTFLALHVGGPVPSSVLWQRDILRLPAVLDALPHGAPAVVGGDFNATQDTAQFRRLLRNGWADVADQAGAGLVRTFPADRWFPPLIGIDHVLTRSSVGRDLTVVTLPGSDHRALVARVRLAPS